MKLRTFAVWNYRSISRTGKLPIGDFTVLVGPNNEGKSNILRALTIALHVVSVGQRFRIRHPRTRLILGNPVSTYDWLTDFPSNLQDAQPGGKTRFELEFELTGGERKSFRAATGSWLSTPLRVVIELDRTNTPTFDILIQGPAKQKLSSKKVEIANFLGVTLDFSYIPSVRQSDWSTGIMSEMIDRELETLHEDPQYKNLQDQIRKLEQPVLERIGDGVRQTLRGFIPDVKQVSFEVEDAPGWRRAGSRDLRVLVDDGHLTRLDQKGDGMQSLAAIALMNQTSQSRARGKGLILAIEEPESHLHPKAIHELRSVLHEISKHSQVVITTHSPTLVNRQQIENNIIVQTAVAKRASSLQEIRESIGVKVSDNLVAADLILLVEGEQDVGLIASLLKSSSSHLTQSLSSGRLALDSLRSAANLSYEVQRYKRLLCNVHAFVDDDEEGRTAVKRAVDSGVLAFDEVHVATCPGRGESEIEDLLSLDAYRERVRTLCGLDLDVRDFRAGNAKWSDRVQSLLKAQGKPHSAANTGYVKAVANETCGAQGISALNPHCRGAFDALRSALEKRLGLPSMP